MGACMGNMLLAGCPAIHLICAAMEGCSRIKDQPVHHILWRTAKHKIVLQLPFIHQLLQHGRQFGRLFHEIRKFIQAKGKASVCPIIDRTEYGFPIRI